jgi:hypothetical protein
VWFDLGKEFIAEKISERKKARITHRLLVRANDPGLIPPLETYHSIPDKYFSKHPLYSRFAQIWRGFEPCGKVSA